MTQKQNKWNLSNLPPKGHAEVAEFAESLFEIARQAIDDAGKHDDWLANYALYRGGTDGSKTGQTCITPVNLYFSNVERSVANITAREPVGEVVDLDGTSNDGAEDILSSKLRKWWKETNEQTKIRSSARTMEIYGITTEKPSWDKSVGSPSITVNDPYSFYPAPGYFEDIGVEAPFLTYAYLKYVDVTEKEFGVKDLVSEEAYELLGTAREEYKGTGYGPMDQSLTGKYADPMVKTNIGSGGSVDKKLERCLVKELWVRDFSTTTIKDESHVINPETGMPEVDENGEPMIQVTSKTVPVYPDGIRKITFAASKSAENKSGYVVLDDCANPNINPALDVDLAMNTYPWGRLPCYHANSYSDLVSLWGFAAAEQVGDLIIKINQVISKLINYVIGVMAPPLIVQRNCGISDAEIETSLRKGGRLILRPTTPNARIEFMAIPNLPSTFFQVLELMVGFFDRIYAIESADRGQAPKGVIAASAIVSLQERNQELMQAKTASIESLAENRSRWCIGLYQNFGTMSELVEVGGEPAEFIGTQFAGRKFSFVVETGSTTPKTSLQVQEQAMNLASAGFIDRQALLETLNFPNWKDIIERSSEGQVAQALQILIAAGLPEEAAVQLQEYCMEPGQGPGGTSTKKSTAAKTAKAGTPKSKQGA
jgi:hypothetical protein